MIRIRRGTIAEGKAADREGEVIRVNVKHRAGKNTRYLEVLRSLLVFGFVAASASAYIAGLAGCGKKGMPSPPGVEPAPAVSDLSYELEGTHVRLQWTVPSDIAGGEAIVSRAVTKLDDEMCDECPLVFQRVAVVSIHPQPGAETQTCLDSLSPGFRYTYRVVLKTDDGRTGGASNLVTFDY